MIHGPSGKLNPKSPCMVDGKCSKEYPKCFNELTIEGDGSYHTYRRRDNGVNFHNKQHKMEIDNQWVVPHNLYLVSKYICHVNVEICASVAAVKYLYKYI